MNYVLSRSYFSLVATFLRSFVRSPQAAWINYVSFFFKLNFPCLSFLSTRNENFLFVYLFILSGKRSESDLRIHVSHRRVNLPRGYVYLHREKKKITNDEKRSSLENLGAISAGKFTRRSNLIKNSKEQPWRGNPFVIRRRWSLNRLRTYVTRHVHRQAGV